MKQKLWESFLICFFITISSAQARILSPFSPHTNARTVMVQLFEWPWKSIAQECENYLGPKGFSAIQVSPPQEHLSTPTHPWWERYQVASYQIFSRSGNEADFADMISRCKKSGVDVYADVVVNHTAGVASGVGIAGTQFTEYEYPGLYSYDDFHHCGRNGDDKIINYKDRYELQFCELFGLSDLKTESVKVRQTLRNYLNHLLDLGVAGFRIDAAKHIPASDLKEILSSLKLNAYILSETILGDDDPVYLWEYQNIGDVNFFPFSFDIGATFVSHTIDQLPYRFLRYPDSQTAVVFVENHDLERQETSAIASRRMYPKENYLAQIFMLTWPYGYPQIYSGYQFQNYDDGPPVDAKKMTLQSLDKNGNCLAPWTCTHRDTEVANLVAFRNYTDSSFFASKIWSLPGVLSFSRGHEGHVVINSSTSKQTLNVLTDLADGVYCNILETTYSAKAKSCPAGLRVQKGLLSVNLEAQSAIVLQENIKISAGKNL